MTDKALFWRAQLYELQKSSSQVEQFVVPKLRVLFIGDSIIGSFPVKSMVSQEYVVANHVVGDSIRDIARRYIEVTRLHLT